MDFAALLHDCAPTVAPALVQALIRTESGFDPLALHLNGPVRLRTPPRTTAQAARWADWLIGQGYSVDMGLMQINSRNLPMLNLTPADAFDPCKNVRAGVTILTAQYTLAAQVHGLGPRTLLEALSAYNTGNFRAGFANGYVGRVLVNGASGRRPAPPVQPDPTLGRLRSPPRPLDLTCLLTHCPARPFQVEPAQTAAADTAVEGFDPATADGR